MSENKDDVLFPVDNPLKQFESYGLRPLPPVRRLTLQQINDNPTLMNDEVFVPVEEFDATIESLRRELDAVRRDGERYRWLRKQMPADAITIESTRPRPATRSLHLSEDEADSAIDAAISEARGRE